VEQRRNLVIEATQKGRFVLVWPLECLDVWRNEPCFQEEISTSRACKVVRLWWDCQTLPDPPCNG